MDEDELPILTKPVQETDPNKTEDGLPILKKKDVSGSPGLGGTDFITQQRQQFEQQEAPSKKSTPKSTDTNNWQKASEIAKSASPLLGAVVDFTRKVASGLVDELPQAIAQGMEVAKSAVNPASAKEFIESVPVDFQNYVREKEGLAWYEPFDQKKYIDKYAENFMKDTGRADIAKNIEANRPEIIARRKGVEEYVQKQKAEGAEKMAGAVQSYKQIHNLEDVASYIGTLGGNAAYQIPLSVLTKGGSSLLQESATIYDQQLDNEADKIIDKEGLSREAARKEVIARGLDKPAEGQAYAVLAAALDKASAVNIMKAFKSGGGQMVKKWVNSAVPEAVTEPVQGVLEDVGAGGDLQEALASSKRIDELAGGLVGGSMGVLNPTTVVNQVRENLDVTDPAALDAAGENVEQALNTQENAIPITSSGSPDVQSTSRDSKTVEEGIPEPRFEKTSEENQSETQKIIDEQQGIRSASEAEVGATTVQPQPNIEGLQKDDEGVGQPATQESRAGEGETVLPRPDEQTGDSAVQPAAEPQKTEPSTEGVEQQRPTTEDIEVTEGKPYAIATRILESDADEAIKRGVKQKGANYIPKGLNITDAEAKNLIELYGDDKAESLIRDTKNDLTGDTRTALAARLYEKYKSNADRISDPQEKQTLYDKAVDIALTSAEQLKEAGRQANAAKIWKAITSNADMTALAIEKENQLQGRKILEPIYKQVKRSRQQFDEQIESLISKRVQEGVEQQLKRAKLITSEQRKKISNAFDALKVKDVGGAANDITRVLGASVWNGSIEAVKRAVLAGADLANAIQAGVQYIRENHKGEWDESEYKSAISPAVEQMIPKDKVDPSQIDQQQIKTPKLSGKRKKEFIDQVVEAYNQGKLTDERFEQLYAKQLGAREFTPEDRSKIRELAKTISEVEQFEEKVKNDFTKENIAKYKDLLAKAQKANTALQQYAQKPSNIWDTMISIMQGNLLTPLSLVTNIYSNTALQPLRFLSTGIGSIVDYSVSQLAKTGMLNSLYKDKTIDLVELQKGYFTGGWNGVLEGGKQIVTGPKGDERSLREINNAFSPVRAIARWADGNRTAEQKANDYLEGTLGIPAEVMFRLLNAGDKPFRRAAETARAMEIGSQKKLKGKDLEKFLLFPDPESAELIQKAGDEATFQQESDSSKVVQKVLSYLIEGIGKTPILGGPLKVIAKSQIPYVKTPWNIMVETLKYAAFPVTGAVGIHQLAKGNKRTGSVLIGQAIVGAMIFAVAKELFSIGLLSWDEPYDQKAGKQRERRQIQYDNIPPNALNVSAIQRGLMPGGDWSIHDDDVWIDYNKLGVVGLLFDNYSNNYFSNIKEEGQMPEESEMWVDMLTTAPRVLSQSLDQSFLKGTNTFITALQDGGGYEAEQWVISTSGALAAIAYPNTLSTISKSEDEFIRDTKDDSFVQRLKNTYKTKFFVGDQLPPKVNLWGEKITGNPEGRNKYAYYLFDPTKFKNVDTENFKYKLYTAWKDSKFDDDYLPSIPKREITYRKVKIKLNAEQYERLATAIGEQRRNLASTYINSAGFDRKDKEKVIKKLKDLYKEGAERGKKQFLRDSGWNILTPSALENINKN